MLCRLSNLFDAGNYNQCIIDYLGPQYLPGTNSTSSGSSGGGGSGSSGNSTHA